MLLVTHSNFSNSPYLDIKQLSLLPLSWLIIMIHESIVVLISMFPFICIVMYRSTIDYVLIPQAAKSISCDTKGIFDEKETPAP